MPWHKNVAHATPATPILNAVTNKISTATLTVDEAAKNECTSILAHQAIAENNNISVSDDDIKAYIEEMYGEGSYDTTLESYGKPYLAQEALQNKVHELLVENATVK